MDSNHLIKKYSDKYVDYLRDESRLAGEAESISFPRSQSEIKEILKYLHSKNTSITIQGGRTGITGGAVPQGGHILNLSRMNKITGLRFDRSKEDCFILVQPGVTLHELSMFSENFDAGVENWDRDSIKALEFLKSNEKYFLPPNPTETAATIGGIVSCRASGSRSYKYGALNKYINKLSIVFSNGDSFSIERGKIFARNGVFSFKTDSGRNIAGVLPNRKNIKVKNACGYNVSKNMDIIDIFIGMEGTLGVITEIELKLKKLPLHIWSLTIFLPDEKNAVEFVHKMQNIEKNRPVAIEYYSEEALLFLKRMKEACGIFNNITGIPDKKCTAVYVEFHGNSEEELSETVFSLSGTIENFGGSDSDTWIGTEKAEVKKMKDFRHAVPEAVNNYIDIMRGKGKEIRKLGTDMSVPRNKLFFTMDMYKKDLEKENLEHIIFGHIGDAHLHVNILPRSKNEYDRGKNLYKKWALKIVNMGGSVSAEHGIGKEKKDFYRIMYSMKEIEQMYAFKLLFDKKGILGTGNLF